jgi:hypothetical protein
MRALSLGMVVSRRQAILIASSAEPQIREFANTSSIQTNVEVWAIHTDA